MLVTVAAGAVLAGLVVGWAEHEQPDRTVEGSPLAATPSSPTQPTTQPPQSVPPPVSTTSRGDTPSCDTVLAKLPERTRLGQLLVTGVPGGSAEKATELVRDAQVGALFVHDNAMALLSRNALAPVVKAGKVAPLIAVDDEGGRVQTIDPVAGDLPSPRAMAASMTPRQVTDVAAKRGRYLRAAGVTVDFAPDADVSDEPDDAVIGDRSFSNDPAKARKYTVAFAKGLAASGVLPVLKHFPGHGHGSGDSHKGTVTTPPLAQLERDDLVPYQNIGDYGPVAVMLGHLDVPGLTNGTPASLSPAAYKLLREKYAFDGLAVTDDLGAMRAISAQYDLPEAVLTAIKAGADMALWSSGERASEVLDRLVRAQDSGELEASRAQDAEAHVLAAKGLCH
ncbi:glycoside hydrolase family 3 N-terminal domain-containing protein [Labedaea rhizosphaerae]|uniref:glycoside hydrolase family 3 N-terminal domain-containing protein n=1 Tax=Labedaea rhizosphaerae TaxID=598644 RepID=UPI003C7AAB17